MATLGNKKNNVKASRSDLNKAVLKKNESLKRSNETIESRIKSLEKDKKSHEKDLKSTQSKIDKTNKELESKVEDLNYASDKLFEVQKRADKASCTESECISSYDKHAAKLKEVRTESSKLASNVVKDKIELEIVSLQLKGTHKNLKALKEDVSKLKSSKAYYKKELPSLEERYEGLLNSREKISNEVTTLKETSIKEIQELSENYAVAKNENVLKISNLHNDLVNKNIELDDIDGSIVNAKDKYKKIQKDMDKAKKATKDEKAKIKEIRANYEKWKISAIDEVARLKLRGRIENIDKAGLKDVLN